MHHGVYTLQTLQGKIIQSAFVQRHAAYSVPLWTDNDAVVQCIIDVDAKRNRYIQSPFSIELFVLISACKDHPKQG